MKHFFPIKAKSESEKKRIILVIDDAIFNLEIAKKALENNYDVAISEHAFEIASMIANHKPDVILLDLQLGEQSGFDTLKEIQQNKKNEIPVIIY